MKGGFFYIALCDHWMVLLSCIITSLMSYPPTDIKLMNDHLLNHRIPFPDIFFLTHTIAQPTTLGCTLGFWSHHDRGRLFTGLRDIYFTLIWGLRYLLGPLTVLSQRWPVTLMGCLASTQQTEYRADYRGQGHVETYHSRPFIAMHW